MKAPKFIYKTVMLIDDSEIDNFINAKMIEGCSFASRVYAHSGAKSALEFLHNIYVSGKGHEDLIPELIFLDLNMPVMDGFQFINEFEKFSPQFRKNIKVIMFTTSVNPADSERALQTGTIHSFVIKPLSQSSLEKLKPELLSKGTYVSP